MSFKHKLLTIYAKYNLNPTSLARRLGYSSAEKISRLTRNEKNLPSIEIIQDILKSFPELNARWLVLDEYDMSQEVLEPRVEYGFCKECIKKEGVIEHLKKEISAKEKRIEEFLLKFSEVHGGKDGQANSDTKAS